MRMRLWGTLNRRFFQIVVWGIVVSVAVDVSLSTLWAQDSGSDVPVETGVGELPAEETPKSPEMIVPRNKQPEASDLKRDLKSSEPPFDYTTLYDAPETLKRLDRKAPIWVTGNRKFVVLGGKVCLREGSLEFFACSLNSKEHESIVVMDVPPHLIHAALLAIGARQGEPAKFEPEFVPPTGDEINLEVCWRDSKNGGVRRVRAQEWVREEISGKTMSAAWVFTGGLFGVDPDGKKYYLANVTGEVFGVSNFPGSVLDVPFESSCDNTELYYEVNAGAVPEIDTNVILILSRAEKSVGADARP